MTTTKTCPVCAKALDASRLAKHAHAVLCGVVYVRIGVSPEATQQEQKTLARINELPR